MSQQNSFQPNWVSLPGDTITDIMRIKNLSVGDLAKLMKKDVSDVKNLLYGKISINKELAITLSNTLGSSTEFWLNREKQYQEGAKRLKAEAEQKWLNALPVKDMIRLGWIKKTENLIRECLGFFDVPNIWSWHKEYENAIVSTAFRKSQTIKSIPAAVIAWLRFGEIKSNEIDCAPWNPDRLIQSIEGMRKLMGKKKPQDFIPELRLLCAKCGIALVIQRTPEKCPASGATKFVSPTKAMILLSFRYLSDDQFWFTFFHEVAHLVKHSDRILFIEDGNAAESTEEIEANDFSSEVLIPAKWQSRFNAMRPTQVEIKKLSREAHIPLGVIVGQLQFLGRLPYNYLNGFKRRYDIKDIMEVSQ